MADEAIRKLARSFNALQVPPETLLVDETGKRRIVVKRREVVVGSTGRVGDEDEYRMITLICSTGQSHTDKRRPPQVVVARGKLGIGPTRELTPADLDAVEQLVRTRRTG